MYSQGVTNVRKVIVDTETGMNYHIASRKRSLHGYFPAISCCTRLESLAKTRS